MSLNTNLVKAFGPRDAKIFFVGEAPGEEENNACEPFIGAAGQFLNRVFRAKGIIRSEVLIGNIFNKRPPKNNVGYFYQDKGKKILTWEGEEMLSKLQGFLYRRLKEREESGEGINVIVAMGVEALKHLTGKKRINKWRGSVLPCTLVPGFKVYATYHSSHVMRLINEPVERLMGEKKKDAQNVLPLFEVDFDRIKIQSESPTFRLPERKFEIDLTHNELVSRLKDLINEPYVGVDIETYVGQPGGLLLWCIGFAKSPGEAFVVPIIKGGRFAWSLDDEAVLWYHISKFFLSKSIKIFQGGMYDLAILGRYYGIRCAKGTYGDTMYCHHSSYPYLRKALEVLCSMYTWEPYFKSEGKVTLGKRNDISEFRYNAKDCCTTREIYPVTVRNAKELATYEGYQRTLSILPSHLGMTIRGIRIDHKKKAELGILFNHKALEAHNFVEETTGMKVNLNSSDQKRKLLYGYLGLEIQFNFKTKKPTVDKDALNKLKKKYPKEPTLAKILDYQKYSKLASTYTSMRTDSDGRIRTAYSLVSTWRMNSRSSPFGGFKKEDREGGNLQNIPKRGKEGKLIRSIFIPDPDKVMLASDRVQAEAQMVAWLSGDTEKIKFFLEGRDAHWFEAKRLFGLPQNLEYSDATEETKVPNRLIEDNHTLREYREIAKTVVFACFYGMGPRKMQEILSLQGFAIDLAMAKNLLMTQKASSPNLLEWQREIREEVRATRTLVSPIGRKRQFLGRFNANLYNACYAFKPQNTVGEITEVTIQRIWEELDYFEILLNVHDEVIGQCLPKDIPRAIEDIRRLSSYPIEIKGRTLDIPVSFKVGDSWGNLKEIS